MRSSFVLIPCVLALAGCGSGGGPPIDKTVATKLANQADAIAAARNPCTARRHARILQRQTIAAINAGRIPAAYLETMQSRVNAIAAAFELGCLPTPSLSSTESSAPPVVTSSRGRGRHGEKTHGSDEEKGED